MTTEQLTGLQMAIALLAQIGDDDSDRAIAAVHDLADERDEWKRIASAYSTQKEISKALEQAKASGRQARNERDELRTKYDELLVALHGIGAALGIPEGDRSPYSVTCGVLERVNRLAEIEAQEPVAISKARNLFWAGNPQDWRGVDCSLYAAPVPAQAAPMSDERIDAIAEIVTKGMPDGICGFMRTWGYQQFARALLEVCAGHYRAQAVPDADGARYRWLKTRPIDAPTNGPDLAWWSDGCGDALRGDDADAAIDAAMAAAPEHKA